MSKYAQPNVPPFRNWLKPFSDVVQRLLSVSEAHNVIFFNKLCEGSPYRAMYLKISIRY
ncbi:hypothetical protein DAQ1742_02578 [Dickeya aquatica]|uniref:Uncharacterized protein n=1 Tax=Dickeya aquatica TaxID=1401087 RepID=A0A375AC08_9GAMM|nr:hypothetical protein DAQ1742_02578 [Dickeya aquatica]